MDPFFEKSRLVRVMVMAERCLAGDFGGSYYLAAKEPECVELGIMQTNIQYHMDKIDLVASSSFCPSGGPGACRF